MIGMNTALSFARTMAMPSIELTELMVVTGPYQTFLYMKITWHCIITYPTPYSL